MTDERQQIRQPAAWRVREAATKYGLGLSGEISLAIADAVIDGLFPVSAGEDKEDTRCPEYLTGPGIAADLRCELEAGHRGPHVVPPARSDAGADNTGCSCDGGTDIDCPTHGVMAATDVERAPVDDDDPRCPLLVVRKHYDEGRDAYDCKVERCGEEMFVEGGEAEYLDGSGTTGPDWKVTCVGGHVVLVPDHEADDNYSLIPFSPTYIDALFAPTEAEHDERDAYQRGYRAHLDYLRDLTPTMLAAYLKAVFVTSHEPATTPRTVKDGDPAIGIGYMSVQPSPGSAGGDREDLRWALNELSMRVSVPTVLDRVRRIRERAFPTSQPAAEGTD